MVSFFFEQNREVMDRVSAGRIFHKILTYMIVQIVTSKVCLAFQGTKLSLERMSS